MTGNDQDAKDSKALKFVGTDTGIGNVADLEATVFGEIDGHAFDGPFQGVTSAVTPTGIAAIVRRVISRRPPGPEFVLAGIDPETKVARRGLNTGLEPGPVYSISPPTSPIF